MFTSQLNAFALPLPPVEGQLEVVRRVSEALAAADDAERQLDAEAADAARLKQSILKAAFEGRLVPQDPNDEPASRSLESIVPPSQSRRRRGRPARELEPT